MADELLVGTYVSANLDGSVLIDFGLGAVTCLSAGFYQPLPGEPVRVLRTEKGTVMLGPAVPMSVIGTVTATGTPLITVDTSVGSRQFPYVLSYTPQVADEVLILNNVVVGEVSSAPAGSYVPETPPVSEFSVTFRARDSGSYQSGWWTTQPWASNSNKGAWFYGDIDGTIPDGATITRVRVYLPEFYNPYPAELAAVGLHSLSSKSGALSLSSSKSVKAGKGWRDLPVSFGNALKTGAAKGVGVEQDTPMHGYHKFRSRAEDANSGALRIDWRI